MTRVAVLLLAALGACADYPRDVEGTLERVKAEKSFTVAVDRPEGAAIGSGQALVAAVAREVGAKPQVVPVDAGETPLLMIESGEIDLLIAPLDPKSPWAKRVTIGPLIAETRETDQPARLAPITRNGENAWVDRVHRAALRVKARS